MLWTLTLEPEPKALTLQACMPRPLARSTLHALDPDVPSFNPTALNLQACMPAPRHLET